MRRDAGHVMRMHARDASIHSQVGWRRAVCTHAHAHARTKHAHACMMHPVTAAAHFHRRRPRPSVVCQFMSDVMKPMLMDPLMDQEVKYLSGGELQRVALVIALGTPADIYLIDEPSAYLDSEQVRSRDAVT